MFEVGNKYDITTNQTTANLGTSNTVYSNAEILSNDGVWLEILTTNHLNYNIDNIRIDSIIRFSSLASNKTKYWVKSRGLNDNEEFRYNSNSLVYFERELSDREYDLMKRDGFKFLKSNVDIRKVAMKDIDKYDYIRFIYPDGKYHYFWGTSSKMEESKN